jgi:hypothetical protein
VEGSPDAGEGAGRRIALTLGVALVALVAIVAVALFAGGADSAPKGFPDGSVPPRKVGDLDGAVRAADCSLRDPESEGRQQTGETVDYRSDPPHSGDHAPEPPTDGAYRSDPPATEAVVHALFHGRIVIWFRPDLDDDQLGSLKALFDEAPEHMLLIPRASMEPEVAATAWTHVLACPEMNDSVFDAIRAFRDTWRDTAPEFVP